MRIRRVEGTPDFSRIIELINAEWPAEFGNLSDQEKIRSMEESHSPGFDTVKYLWDNDEPVGFYRYTIWPREEQDSKTAHSLDISLLPERQHEGLGTMLMKDMIEDCKRSGFKTLLSRSFKNNEASVRLHRAVGFSLHFETDDSFVWAMDL